MKQVLINAAFLLGLASVTTGCVLLHPAAGFIVGGTLLAYFATQLDAPAEPTKDAR